MTRATVSVVIPTRNSANMIQSCIRSIHEQSYSNIEIIIVDSESTDYTVEISKQMQCQVISTDWKLLGARYRGLKAASGNYVLMLDSDQVLMQDTIERSMALLQKYDMLVLEEMPYNAKTLIQKMFEADRRLVHNESRLHIDPIYGAMLARFYKRDLLERAFNSISELLFPFVVAHDHAIIYYEAWKLSSSVGIVPNAVLHNEPATLIELWKKNFRYGKSTKKLLEAGYYNDFVNKKTRTLRKTKKRISKDKFLSSLLLFLKAPAYFTGLYL